jgi:hypothetical protein
MYLPGTADTYLVETWQHEHQLLIQKVAGLNR